MRDFKKFTKTSIGLFFLAICLTRSPSVVAQTPGVDYYKVIGVERSASIDEIKRNARRLMRVYHPDNNGGDESRSAKFQEVNEAYQVLTDSEKRARYDTGVSLKPKSENELYYEAIMALKAAAVSSPIPLFGALPDPNEGNPMKTLGDLARYKKPKVPTEMCWIYGNALANSVSGDLESMTSQLVGGLETQVLQQMASVVKVLSIFDVTDKWIQMLPGRIEWSSRFKSDEFLALLLRANFLASWRWLVRLRPFSEYLFQGSLAGLFRVIDSKIYVFQRDLQSKYRSDDQKIQIQKSLDQWKQFKRDIESLRDVSSPATASALPRSCAGYLTAGP